MAPAFLSAFSCGCGATSASKHLFSSAPSPPSFNDPLPIQPSSLSSSLSLPKRRGHKASTFQSKPINPVSPTEDAKFSKFSSSKRHWFKYPKPLNPTTEPTVLSSERQTGDDRSVVISPSGVSYRLPGAPFDFQFSYSETPSVAPIAIREPAFLPFAPPSMPRPWTGKAPILSKKEKDIKKGKKIHLIEPLGSGTQTSESNELVQNGGLVKQVMGKKGLSEQLRLGLCKIRDQRSREEVLGAPLTKIEIRDLVKPHLKHNRQVNIGRDGLTHNMLELVHCHWRRDQICKVRCRGVPTIDMNNIIKCLEEKTRGKVIYKTGGILYLFRGRHYDVHTRPRYPIMLWKPAAPVYPKLIQDVPEGLTRQEAVDLRQKGEKLLPICKLAKNGIYIKLVKYVRNAFEGCELTKIDCRGMPPSDYKKLGAKLKDLVPCVLLSFDNEQILIYRGKNWKSQYPIPLFENPISDSNFESSDSSISGESDDKISNNKSKVEASTSSKMLLLYNDAIESSKALLLTESELSNLNPNSLLKRVEEFESLEQSYSALNARNGQDDDNPQIELVHDEHVDQEELNNQYDGSLGDNVEESVPFGSLPIDLIVGNLGGE